MYDDIPFLHSQNEHGYLRLHVLGVALVHSIHWLLFVMENVEENRDITCPLSLEDTQESSAVESTIDRWILNVHKYLIIYSEVNMFFRSLLIYRRMTSL